MTDNEAAFKSTLERLYRIVEDTGLNVRTRVIETERAIIEIETLVLPAGARLDRSPK